MFKNVGECWIINVAWQPCWNSLFWYHGPRTREQLTLDIFVSQVKYLIQNLMTAFVEIGSRNQVIAKSLEIDLYLLILFNSRLPNIRDYSLWRNSAKTFVEEYHLP